MTTNTQLEGRSWTEATTGTPLEAWARRWVWALPVWGGLLAISTVTHQPSSATDFAGYADYVTTAPFLVSHIVASIGGAVLAILGAIALTVALSKSRVARSALRGMLAYVGGQVAMTCGFAVAAFFQPAVGRAFQDGHETIAKSVNDDVYGAGLTSMLVLGLLLFVGSSVVLGRAAQQSDEIPSWAGRLFAVAGPAFAISGFTIQVVQPVAGVLIAVSGTAMARSLSTGRSSSAVHGRAPKS
jgi:hypothetical protein